MSLNAWQKLTHVLPGQPFGDAIDGDVILSGTPTLPKQSCSGTSGNASLTIAAADTFANGDVVVLVQMRGTAVGSWEFAKISSGGGSTSLTLTLNKQYTYTDSGASQAQIVKYPRYRQVTASTTTYIPAWDKNTGGFLGFAAKYLLPGANLNGVGKGCNPTGDGDDCFARGDSGEGSGGDGVDNTNSANGNGGGGGGGGSRETPGGGAGGGHATSGTNGAGNGPGIGGGTVGQNEPTTVFMGGAGGSGGGGWNVPTGQGGYGSGIFILCIKRFGAPNLVDVSGDDGEAGTVDAYTSGDGGGGAAGSFVLMTEIADLGTDKFDLTGGATGGGSGFDGGTGGKGRMSIYYGRLLSGSVSSSLYGSYYTELDDDLRENRGSALLAFAAR